MKVIEGEVPATSQAGLKSTWRAQGYFLPCVCVPNGDLTIDESEAHTPFEGQISRVEVMTPTVLRVKVEVESSVEFEGGQFIHLERKGDGLTRPYSIASTRSAHHMELHVAILPGGAMSNWLREAEGETVNLWGPAGECFYASESKEEPLLLVGTGTGLAPLLGVVRTAIERGHRGPIVLYRGSAATSALYMRDELRALSAPSLTIVECVLDDDVGSPDVRTEAVDAAVFSDLPKLDGFRVYLCGNPDMVRKLKKKAFLAGASLQNIYSDPFVTAPPPTVK